MLAGLCCLASAALSCRGLTGLCKYSLRATGITAYIGTGGALETTQAIVGHAGPRTTQFYDRTGDQIALDEIERM